MATNGNNNDGKIEYTQNINSESGVYGYIRGNEARQQFQQKFWSDDGYLANSLSTLNSISKLYDQIAKQVDNMSSAERKSFKEKRTELDEQIKALKTMQDIQETTDSEAIDTIKSTGKMSETYQKLAIKYMNSITENLNKSGKLTKDEAKTRQKSLEKALKQYHNYVDLNTKNRKEVENISKILDKSSDNFSQSLSKTLRGAGDKLASLSNMFNIQSLASNSMEQNARSKLSIQGSVSRQFGFTNTQFETFKNSLNDTVKNMNKEMGGLFNSEDMKTYLSNLSAYGITDPKIAQQQFKNSAIATKYLGVSADTQAAIFKYMKLTNNNDALAKHNKTVVGLLKSQLGVSKDQLDQMSQQTYDAADALAALGADSNTTEKYINESTYTTAALDSIQSGFGTSMSKIINEMTAMPLDEYITKYGKILGGTDATTARNYLYKGDVEEAVKTILSSQYLSNTLSKGDLNEQGILQKELGISDVSGLANMIRYFNTNGTGTLDDKIDEAIKSINETTDKDVEDMIKNTQEATMLEKISNNLDTWFNGFAWKNYLSLANTAFGLYIASDIVGFLGKSFDKNGGIGKLLTSIIGKDSAVGKVLASDKFSSAMGLLSTGGLIVGLTAGTVAALGSYFSGKVDENYHNKYDTNLKNLTGYNKGNTSVASAKTMVDSAKSQSKFAEGWSNTGTGLSYAFNLFNKDKDSRNAYLTQWMYKSNTFGNYDQVMAWMTLMDALGSLSAVNNKLGTNYTTEGLKNYALKDQDSFQNIANNISAITKAGWKPFKDNNGSKITSWDDAKSYFSDYVKGDSYRTKGQGGPIGGFIPAGINYNKAFNFGIGGDLKSMIKSPWLKVTSMWGSRPNPFGGNGTENHGGMDIAAPVGTKVGSAVNGTVYLSGPAGSFGNAVYIIGDNGMRYIYGHFSRLAGLSSGQRVNAGQLIGYVGSTGRSTGPHLHFQVGNSWSKSGSVDPTGYLNNNVLFPGSGSSESVTSSTASTSTNNNEAKTVTINNIPKNTNRFIPQIFRNQGGQADNTAVVSSVNGGFDKLINYLESIRDEQQAQKQIINAFIKSRDTETIY